MRNPVNPEAQKKRPGIRIFYFRDRDFYRGMGYPDKKPPLILQHIETFIYFYNSLCCTVFMTIDSDKPADRHFLGEYFFRALKYHHLN